jgi:hypothetical protein
MKKLMLSISLLVSISDAGAFSSTATKKAPDLRAILPEGCELVDETKAILYGPERTRVFTKLETEAPGMDGMPQNVNDLMDRELICQEAIKFKVPVDEASIDRYIASVCEQYKIKPEQIPDVFGFSLDKVRAELGDLYLNNQIISNVVISRLHVSREDVLAYYEQNPVYQEASYRLQSAFVPFERGKNPDAQSAEIAQKIKDGKTDSFVWADPFWIKDGALAEHMSFIKDMNIADVAAPRQAAQGFQVFRLVERTASGLVPLENRYKEIENTLRNPQMEKKVGELKLTLRNSAAVVLYE